MHKQNTDKPSSIEEDVKIDKPSSNEEDVKICKPSFEGNVDKPHVGSTARNFVQPSYEGNNALNTIRLPLTKLILQAVRFI